MGCSKSTEVKSIVVKVNYTIDTDYNEQKTYTHKGSNSYYKLAAALKEIEPDLRYQQFYFKLQGKNKTIQSDKEFSSMMQEMIQTNASEIILDLVLENIDKNMPLDDENVQ